MNFSISQRSDGAVVVALTGELDVATSDEFREALEVLVTAPPSLVELDLGRLRMIDSIGIGVLVRFYKGVRDRGGDVVLRDASGQPLVLFRLLQLDRMMMGTLPSVEDRSFVG